MRLKTPGKSPVRIQEFTDHGPNTGFYGPHVNQSECRTLQSHIIIMFNIKILKHDFNAGQGEENNPHT